jgi:hypothetical protein
LNAPKPIANSWLIKPASPVHEQTIKLRGTGKGLVRKAFIDLPEIKATTPFLYFSGFVIKANRDVACFCVALPSCILCCYGPLL